MKLFASALQLASRMPVWLAALVGASLVAGLIWTHGSLSAKRAAQIETLQAERSASDEHHEQSEELRDGFEQIEEDAAAGGDGAVIERLRKGHFAIAPGLPASDR